MCFYKFVCSGSFYFPRYVRVPDVLLITCSKKLLTVPESSCFFGEEYLPRQSLDFKAKIVKSSRTSTEQVNILYVLKCSKWY